MPVNSYTVGKDVTLDIITPQGVLRPKIRTGFQAKQETVDKKVERADGVIDHLILPQGWSGSFDFERAGPELDIYFEAREADYFNGKNIENISISQTITERDGSVTGWRWIGVALKYDDAGATTGNNTVKQKVGWLASRRIRVA